MAESQSDQPKPYLLTEAASLTGLSVDAFRKRILRRKLRANRSNEDGLWRVWLTEVDIEAAKSGRLAGHKTGRLVGQFMDSPLDESQVVGVLEAQVAILQAALTRERERADRTEAQASAERSRADQAERERAELREREVRLDGEATRLRDALQLAEAQIQTASRRAEQAQHELTAARQQEVEAVKRAANLEGELDGVKHGMEHLQDLAAQSRREVEEAQRQATEASEQAQKANRATLEAMQELERLRERGWWKRLRGQ